MPQPAQRRRAYQPNLVLDSLANLIRASRTKLCLIRRIERRSNVSSGEEMIVLRFAKTDLGYGYCTADSITITLRDNLLRFSYSVRNGPTLLLDDPTLLTKFAIALKPFVNLTRDQL